MNRAQRRGGEEEPLEIIELEDRPKVLLSASEMVVAMLAQLSTGGSPMDPCENAYQFVVQNGLKFDNKPLSGAGGLDGDYKHLRTVYEDNHPKIVGMAAAQTGKSAWMVVRATRNALHECWGKMMGYYFPDAHLPRSFSKGRIRPFLKSHPKLAKLLGAARTDGTDGSEAMLTLTIGDTLLFLMTIGGKTATEGLPLAAVLFDEVRRMDPGDVARAQERYSAQREPIDLKVSTALFPEQDIHEHFLNGDQRYFHTACMCASGVVLSLSFPDCIADLRHATPALKNKVAHAYSHAGLPYLGMTDSDRAQFPEAAYMCPKCGEILVDVRDGDWEAHRPRNWIHSYQFPQMLSVTYPAGHVLHAFENAVEPQSFYNDKLGLPWIDTNKMPLQAEHVDACVDTSLQWGEHMTTDQRRRRLRNCAMGIDVQAGYGICTIKVRDGDQFRTVHAEVLRDPRGGDDGARTWWWRAGQLMQRYDVQMCVVDEAPEFTASQAFANAFRGRVFLANFALKSEEGPRFVQWDDLALDNDDKQRGETATRHRVSMERTRALHWSIMRWRNRQNRVPNLSTLVQVLPVDGEGKPVFSSHLRVGIDTPVAVGHILREQLCRFVFLNQAEEVKKDREKKIARGAKKWVAEFIGGSPDFAFADLYASVAADRIGKPFGVRGLG